MARDGRANAFAASSSGCGGPGQADRFLGETERRQAGVTIDGGAQPGPDAYVAGARAADAAAHPELRAELDRMREVGFLA